MDFERARFLMTQQQVRPWKVVDDQVLSVMGHLPREKFVPEHLQALAYSDTTLPIGHDQVMLTPKEQGRIAQALALKPSERVLEIGTGTGYLTAILASLAEQVTSVDIFEDFISDAGARLNELGIENVSLAVGDASAGWTQSEQYDAIVITGGLLAVPASYKNALKEGGRLICIIGQPPAMQVRLVERQQGDQFTDHGLFETVVPLLINAPEPARFAF